MQMRWIMAILLAALMAAGTYAQAPRISFDESEYDFGDIPELGGAVSYRFVYTNTGDAPLVITAVKNTCGCTSPAWSREPVGPGRKGFIDVSFDPRDRTGMFTKSVIVSSNASPHPVTLYISGSVVRRPSSVSSEFPFEMGDLRLKHITVNLGKILSTQTVQSEIQLINPSEANIVVEPDPDSGVDFVSLECKPRILKPGERGVLRTRFSASKSGIYSFVKVDVPVLVNGQRHLLHFRGVVDEAFSDADRANPPRMQIADSCRGMVCSVSADGNIARFRILYTNTGKSNLCIRNVMCPRGMELEGGDMMSAPGQSGELIVAAHTDQLQPGRKYQITIFTNVPDAVQERVELQLSSAGGSR